MRLLRIVSALTGAAGLVMAGPGCTAITSGDFEAREAPLVCGNDAASGRVDLRLDLTGMNAHQNGRFVVSLVRTDGVTNRTVARTVYDPLGAADLQIALPCAVIDADHVVTMWADLNGNGSFDPCPTAPEGCEDHQWRVAVEDDGTASYHHSAEFVDITQDAALPIGALPLRAALENMSEFAGRRAEVHLRRSLGDGTFETVFIYRLGQIPGDNATVMPTQENVVQRGERYEVAIWIDTNGNGIYDAPSSIGIEGRDYATTIDAIGEGPSASDAGGVQVFFDGMSPPPTEDIGIEP